MGRFDVAHRQDGPVNLQLSPLTERRAEEAATWFMNDPDGQREFGGFYGAHPKWWDQTQVELDRHAWIAELEDGTPVGFLEIGLGADDGEVHLSYVRAEYRQRGLGTALAGVAVTRARELGVRQLFAAIDPANRASINCCQRAGFTDAGSNSFGETLLVYDLSNAP